MSRKVLEVTVLIVLTTCAFTMISMKFSNFENRLPLHEEIRNNNPEALKKLMSRSYFLRKPSDFFKLLETTTGVCNNLTSFANLDQQKWVCMDEQLWGSNHNCLIYSFGIEPRLGFEINMSKIFETCTFFVCDPILKDFRKYRKYWKGFDPNRLKLYPVGLFYSSVTVSMKTNNDTAFSTSTLLDFQEVLLQTQDDEKVTIDFVKMDIAGSELEVLSDMLNKRLFNNIRQLNVEFHLSYILSKNPAEKWHRILQDTLNFLARLERETGFRRVLVKANSLGPGCQTDFFEDGSKIPLCGQILYVKEGFPSSKRNGLLR